MSSSVFRVEDNDVTPRASKDLCPMGQGALGGYTDAAPRSLQIDRSAHRYCAQLSDLRSRVAQHRANLDLVLDTAPNGDSELSDHSSTPIDDESHALDRKARIERLRRNGWQRKRFDPSRYEALRAAALAELN
ncbi:hypothetical protein SEUCBS139899_008440 [Sporothrix eucalyptigena]